LIDSSDRSPRVGVIQLPGVNCEYETLDALRRAGMEAVLVRWNAGVELLGSLQGYVLPGGFSFQDRIRAGAVAAKEEIVELVARESAKGKPVLGICNGAQVLVEAGLVPGIHPGRVDMGLAPNVMGDRTGYFCRWVFVRACRRDGGSAFTDAFDEGEVIPVPVAHGEGRFVSSDPGVLDAVSQGGQVLFKYCDESGTSGHPFPINPNGSWMDAAGICNPRGNVLALMPHPERAAWLGQLAGCGSGAWGARKLASWGKVEAMESAGPGLKLFQSMAGYIMRVGPWRD
jgi:phosphoribosylformylglycinamidine synthase I